MGKVAGVNPLTLGKMGRLFDAYRPYCSFYVARAFRRILDELNGMFNELQTPLATRIQNNVPIHNELEVGMNHFNLVHYTPLNQLLIGDITFVNVSF